MQLTAPNGQIVNFPEGTRPEVAQAFVERYYPAEPNVVERTIGHLSKGAGATVGMMENLGGMIRNATNALQGKPAIEPEPMSNERYWLENNQMAAQVTEHPETSMVGQVLGGLVEFLPEMPLYSFGGGLALRGAATLPKVGRVAEALLTKSPTALGRYGKAIARGATEGAVVGSTIGVAPGTEMGERLVEGAKSGAEFAGAVAVLHPAFAGLGIVGRGIMRRLGSKATPEKVEAELSKKAETDPKAAEELQALRNARAEAEAEKPMPTEEGELYVPGAKEEAKQGELFVEMPGEVETKKLNELGFDNATIEQKIREGKDQELIDALEKEEPFVGPEPDTFVGPKPDSFIGPKESAKGESESDYVQKLNIDTAKNVGLLKAIHGTTEDVAEKIRRERKLYPGKRLYDYSEYGPDAIYLGESGDRWFEKSDGRTIEYPAKVNIDIKPNARVATVKSFGELQSLFKQAGIKSFEDAKRDLAIDNLTEEGGPNKLYLQQARHVSDKLKKIVDIIYITGDDIDFKGVTSRQIVVLDPSVIKPTEAEVPKVEALVEKANELRGKDVEGTPESREAAVAAEPNESTGELRTIYGDKVTGEKLGADINLDATEANKYLNRETHKLVEEHSEEIAKAKEDLPKIEELKNEDKQIPTEESKEAALDKLEEKVEKPLEEDEDVDWDMLRELEATDDPVAKALVEDMPSNELQFQDKLEGVIKDIIYKRQREKVAKKAKAKAEGKKGRRKKAEEPKPVEKVEVKGQALEDLQKEYEKLLEDEGLGMEAGREELPTESLESSFREDDIHGLDFSDRSARFFDDIEDGVYRDSDGVYLDNLGFHQIYKKLAPHVAKSAKALYHMGKYVYMEGYKSFEAFAKRLKEVTGEAWNSVRRYARDAYNAAKEWNERLGEGGWIRVGQGGASELEGGRIQDKYIGTGEGSGRTAYTGMKGWGHYFSAAKDVYEWYAETIGGASPGGKKHVHEFDLSEELNLLSLDKEIPKEQAKAISDALTPYLEKADERNADYIQMLKNELDQEVPYITGTEVQANLQLIFGGKNASKFMRDKADIHGNTYVGEESGERNYVIFDEKDVPPPVNHYTLDMLGMHQIYEWGRKLVDSRRAQRNAPSNGIIAEVNGKTLTAKDDVEFNEGSMRTLANGIAKAVKARLMTPDFAYKDNERVSPLIFDLHKRFFEGLHAAAKRNEALRVADTMLREVEDRKALKRIIEGLEIPKSEKLRDAALIMRKELEAVREKKKDALRVEMLQNLNKHEFAVISKVLAGKDIAEAIAEYTPRDKLGRRMKSPIDVKVIEDIVKDYKAIDNWGLDNYFTHYEKGSLRIVSGGKLYAKAMSVEDAARKFIDLNKMYPELDFKLDTTNMIGELASGVSKRSYQLIHNDLVKGLEETLGDINKAVARRLANKALEGRFFVKPTKQFSPYTLDRRAKLQGEADPFEIIYHYMYSMEKKMALDPAIDAIRRAMARTEVVGQEPYTAKDGSTKMRDIKQPYLTADEAKYLETYVSDVKGRMYKEDEIVDSVLKGFVAPRAYSRFVARSREVEANLKFAYRPVAGFVNGMSGLGHVWTKVGLRYITEGAAFLRTAEGKQFIKEMEPYLGINVVESATGELTTRGTFERMRLLPAPKTKLGEFGHKAIEPMTFFQAPELPVRKLTLAANYLMAKSEGMSEAAARDVAIKANWFQQFSYDIASLPELMRGPTGRLLTQFKPYLLKELEFISQLRGMEIARYAGMQIALGGPRGLIMLAKSLPIIGSYYGWSELENYLNKEFPKVSRGVGGALGVDISAPATFQFPQALRDWLGPTLSDLMNLYTNVLSPTIDNIVNIGNPDNPDIAVGRAMKSAIPIYKHYANLWDQVVSKDGWVKDERGRRLWHIDNMATFTARSLAGAESLELARIRVYESNLRGKEKRLDDTKTDTVDNILDAIEKGKPIEQSDIDQMIRLGIKPQTLRRAYKFRVLDPKLRRTLMTEVIRRPEILEEYPDANDLE